MIDDRMCNGGNAPGARWCGARAKVVCTDSTRLQWFACANPAHQLDDRGKVTRIEPIEAWFARVLGGGSA